MGVQRTARISGIASCSASADPCWHEVCGRYVWGSRCMGRSCAHLEMVAFELPSFGGGGGGQGAPPRAFQGFREVKSNRWETSVCPILRCLRKFVKVFREVANRWEASVCPILKCLRKYIKGSF